MHNFICIVFLASLIGCLISSVSCIYPLRSIHTYTLNELHSSANALSLPGQSLVLVGEDGDNFYLGGKEALFEVRADSIGHFAKVVTWPQSEAAKGAACPAGNCASRVRSLYFSGPGVAFACAAEADSVGRCRRFDRRRSVVGRCGGDAGGGACEWRPAPEPAEGSATKQLIDAILLPCVGCPPPVALRRAASHVFFAALPPIRDTTDLVELAGPVFADIGFTTADMYSRKNRALWMARGARALRMHEASGRLYVLYTEEAAETDNYVGSVNTDARQGLIKRPVFTRLARVCLNDPGQTLRNQTNPRVLTSFFKLRLICRDAGVDYDVLDLATEVVSSPDAEGGGTGSGSGHFYGLFSPQDSPPGGYLALCQFSIADAERMLTGGDGGGGDFIQMSRANWQQPWSASRLKRAEFAARSEIGQPFDCSWTPAEALRRKLSDLYVERMAPLLARPLIGRSLRALPPSASPDGRRLRRPTALTLLPAAHGATEQLLIGWDTGEVTRLSPSAPAAAVETLQALPGEAVDAIRVRGETPAAGDRRLLVFGASGVASLPLTRCAGAVDCVACRRLGDPLCAWDPTAGGAGTCRDRAELRPEAAAAAAAFLAASAAGAAACASGVDGGGGNDSAALLGPDGLPLQPPIPRLSVSSLGSSGGASGDETGGVGLGVFLGALTSACLLAFAAGVGLGCATKGRKQPGLVGRLLGRQLSLKPQRQPPPDVEKQQQQQQQLHRKGHHRRHPLLPDASSSSAEQRRCQGNEYVQAADLMAPALPVALGNGGIGVSLAAAADARPPSRCSSWESCLLVASADDDDEAVELGLPSLPLNQRPQHPQPQQPVKVSAGFIGQICLSVDLGGESS